MPVYRIIPDHPKHPASGFTLIELIIVILLIGILAGVLFTIIRGPVQSSFETETRVRLVGIAETALQRMAREITLALPNSVRVNGGGNAVEFLRTSSGGRYRARPEPGPGPNRTLKFNNGASGTNGTFDVLGGLASIDNGAPLDTQSPASGESDCLDGTTDCMVVYNTGQAGANAYDGDNVAAIEAYSTADGLNEHEMRFRRASTGFPYESPQQRFQVVDTPVSYVCSGGEIRRYDNYTIQSAQPVPPAGGGALLIDKVSACSFTYDPGTSSRAALLTFEISVSDGNEEITLLQQARVENLP